MMDLTNLASICEGDRTLMREYMALYLEEAPPLFDALLQASAAMDYAALAAAAHGLRAVVNTMGFAELFALVTRMEMLARAHDPAAFALSKEAADLNSAVIDALKEALAKPA